MTASNFSGGKNWQYQIEVNLHSLWKLNLSDEATIFIYSKELVSLFGGGRGLVKG